MESKKLKKRGKQIYRQEDISNTLKGGSLLAFVGNHSLKKLFDF
jgi:hypothetical protein